MDEHLIEGGIQLRVEGMMCTKSCTPRVEKALRAVKGVQSVVVSLESKSALVQGDAHPDELVRAVNATGKIATVIDANSVVEKRVRIEPPIVEASPLHRSEVVDTVEPNSSVKRIGGAQDAADRHTASLKVIFSSVNEGLLG